MCGIAGCALSSQRRPETALEGARRMCIACAGAVRTRKACGRARAWCSATGGLRSSTLRPAPTSRWSRPTSATRLSSTARSTTSANCAGARASGRPFRTTSDTEVLLALTPEGEGMLGRLRGMFAFAIWDTTTRELFLARDPYGIKPLYYRRPRTGSLRVAGQGAARVGADHGQPEPAGLAGFYLWGSVPEPWTLYRDVFALPAGHWLRVRDGMAGTPVCWHDIRVHWRGAAPSSRLTTFECACETP